MTTDPSHLEIDLLIQAIFNRFQYDFRLYSKASIRRRLEQALIKFHCKSISELQNRLLHEADFFPKLLNYLTVNTTELFRDPTYYESFLKNVIDQLKTFPSIKIWVAGCSTGEEIYSLAIFLRESGIKRYLIYATDINPLNLEAAKKGIYSLETVQKGSRNYLAAGGKSSLSDYYTVAYDSVQMDLSLMENVVLSDHSLVTDSVFSEMHFISCRNVLIYFDRELQDRVLHLFYDSLVRHGVLGLGIKETLLFSPVKENFKDLDIENRLYQKII